MAAIFFNDQVISEKFIILVAADIHLRGYSRKNIFPSGDILFDYI